MVVCVLTVTTFSIDANNVKSRPYKMCRTYRYEQIGCKKLKSSYFFVNIFFHATRDNVRSMRIYTCATAFALSVCDFHFERLK